MPEAAKGMLRLEVKEFGPVVSADITLKPLTIFIGPNNSGKSCLAVLIYAFSNSFGRLLRPFGRGFRRRVGYLGMGAVLPEKFEKVGTALKRWFEAHPDELRRREIRIPFDSPEFREVVNDSIQASIRRDGRALEQSLKRCFATEIGDLHRKKSTSKGFQIILHHQKPPWKRVFTSGNGKVGCQPQGLDIPTLSVRFDARLLRWAAKEELWEEQRLELFEPFEMELSMLLYGELFLPSVYLPAARSGILQSHRALVSGVTRRLPLLGIEELQIPKLSGVVADFISQLISLEKARGTELEQIAEFLEHQLTQGNVDIEGNKEEYREIFYKSQVGRFPLHRTSSMVSELAPLVLFLKYVVRPGDLLIIEEPESHLHPGAQRALARGLVRLIRKGVKLLITTHSDYLLGNLNNFILQSQVADKDRSKLGYAEDDYLKTEEVDAYLFELDPSKGGSIVKELEVTAEDGIPEEEFVKVAAALGNEAARLERLIPRKAGKR